MPCPAESQSLTFFKGMFQIMDQGRKGSAPRRIASDKNQIDSFQKMFLRYMTQRRP